MTTLLWLRNDLRLSDNPALHWAIQQNQPILAVYLVEETERPRGAASNWWLHHSLQSLMQHIPLHLETGNAQEILPRLIKQHNIQNICWNRRYTATGIATDTALKSQLKSQGLHVETFNANLLNEPWDIKTQQNTDFKVFTPFWKTCLAKISTDGVQGQSPWDGVSPSLRAEGAAISSLFLKTTTPLAQLNLLPQKNWAQNWPTLHHPGEAGAQARLHTFLQTGLKGYAEGRNNPAQPHFSQLSPHLQWGEISPRQVWHATQASNAPESDKAKFLAEIGWREFAHHLLYYFPNLATQNFKAQFNAYPWAENPQHLKAWQQGQTGYPLVDAGMRELWHTGFIHNRVRMVVASFLIKHLQTDWRQGEKWFWNTLVDACPANNTASWQWVAGSGADAAPYFRIFNPIMQGQKFDPTGTYTRQWLPELAKLPNEFLWCPWQAPELVLHAAGVKLGQTYPHPIVNHEQARQKALQGYEKIKLSPLQNTPTTPQ